jgi:alkylhydroperoxidase family enzyme
MQQRRQTAKIKKDSVIRRVLQRGGHACRKGRRRPVSISGPQRCVHPGRPKRTEHFQPRVDPDAEERRMARIGYTDDSNPDPEFQKLAAQIKEERGGRMLNLYKMLLNSPPVAQGWLNLLTAVRKKTVLKGRYRELTILLVAIINGAEYERSAHVPYAKQEGLSDEQVDSLYAWKTATCYTDVDRAVLAYTEAMTQDVHVTDATFAAVSKHFDQREMTELTALVAAYNLVSRFLEALAIDPEPPKR